MWLRLREMITKRKIARLTESREAPVCSGCLYEIESRHAIRMQEIKNVLSRVSELKMNLPYKCQNCGMTDLDLMQSRVGHCRQCCEKTSATPGARYICRDCFVGEMSW